MQTTLQPIKKCGKPTCQKLIPESVASFMLTIQGDLREVCETCFDTWLRQVRSKKQGRKRLR